MLNTYEKPLEGQDKYSKLSESIASTVSYHAMRTDYTANIFTA